MPVSGVFNTGVKYSIPKLPKLLIVNVVPCISSLLKLPARAFCATFLISLDNSTKDKLFAKRIAGTINPFSNATAMPKCTCSN